MGFSARAATKDAARFRRRRPCTSPRSSSTLHSENFFLDGVVADHLMLPAADTGEPFVDVDDISDVAVAALTQDGHQGQLYELIGPRLWAFAAAVAEIARLTGRQIRYSQVPMNGYAVVGISALSGTARFLTTVAALVYLLGVQSPTFTVNVPLNNRLQRLDAATMNETDRQDARRMFEARWNRWNVVRTVCSSFVSVLLLRVLLRV
jgi:Anthrone oxygenase